jgi:hypothetical protein
MSYDVLEQLYELRGNFERKNMRRATHVVVNHWTEREMMRQLNPNYLHEMRFQGTVMGLIYAVKPYDGEKKIDMVVL